MQISGKSCVIYNSKKKLETTEISSNKKVLKNYGRRPE